jgi:DNA helicase-2/ATP-dependent DNA helicase PcrA
MVEHLNEAQRLAVEHSGGPLLILAGAGTGKTLVLTSRIAHLVKVRKIAPGRIMAVTFTRKAAHEMAARLEGLLSGPAMAGEIQVATFHALSAGLLREAAGASAGMELLPEAGRVDLIKQILLDQGHSGPEWQPSEVLRLLSLAKGRLLSPDDVALDYDPLLAAIYATYQRILKERHLLDFDDLIGSLLECWQEDRQVLASHQNRFAAILVDEFQDINEAQYLWLKLLVALHRNLSVVGDSDQSIYAFRGSNLSIFQRFQEDFPEARVVKLEQNYRSHQRILEAATAVIAHNLNPLTCSVRSDIAPGPLVRLGRLPDEAAEARFVVVEIERLLGGSSHYQIYQGSDIATPEEVVHGFGDIAVLYRTHAQSRPLAEAMSRAGIPFQVVGEKPPFVAPTTDALLAYLRFALDTSAGRDLQIVFNLPPRGLGEQAQKWLAEQIAAGGNPWEILKLAGRNLELPVRHQAAVDGLRRVIERLQGLLSSQPLPEVLETAMEETGLRQYSEESGGTAAAFKWLLLLGASYGTGAATATLPAFLQDLSHWRTGDFLDPRADAVTLMTLHAAKGLEFPIVFICGLDQDLLPLTRRNQDRETLEEERRLFYVAMTRARHHLVLCTARRRFLFGEVRRCLPSPFIKEIPARCLEDVSDSIQSRKRHDRKEEQLSLF